MSESVSRKFDNYQFSIEVIDRVANVTLKTPKTGYYTDESECYAEESHTVNLDRSEGRKFLRSLILELEQILVDVENSRDQRF